MPGGDQVVSKLIKSAFGAARSVYLEEDTAWVSLSMRLVSPTLSPAASSNIQRAGALDLLIRYLEDDLRQRVSASSPKVDFAYHYQKMFSELWVASCYEIARAIRQREKGANYKGAQTSDHTSSEIFVSLLFDLERLRMPLEKYEIAKDNSLKQPMLFRRIPEIGDETDFAVYDSQDPNRIHIMPSGISANGSVMWLAFDHATNREYWIERRELSDRFLKLASSEK
jgi:hypothetical protein